MKKESIKKQLLKRLIQEVIREVDAMAAEKPGVGATEPSSEPETMPHSLAAEKHRGDLMVKLSLKGAKSGPALKKFLGKLAYDAKMNDLQAIHAEIEKSNGQKVASMDITDLEANRPKEDDKFDDTPYRRQAPPVEPGSGEAEWKAMTARDVAAARARAKAAKAAGKPVPTDDEEA